MKTLRLPERLELRSENINLDRLNIAGLLFENTWGLGDEWPVPLLLLDGKKASPDVINPYGTREHLYGIVKRLVTLPGENENEIPFEIASSLPHAIRPTFSVFRSRSKETEWFELNLHQSPSIILPKNDPIPYTQNEYETLVQKSLRPEHWLDRRNTVAD